MKKYFPILASITIFTIYLLSQVFWNYEDSVAKLADEKIKTYANYKSVYAKSTFKDLKGKVYKSSNIKAPLVILNFWASWCVPCLEEFPSIVKMKKFFKDTEVLLLAINTDEVKQKKKIQKIFKKFKFNFPVIPDIDGKHIERFMISAIPVSIIFHKGEVLEVTNGAKDFNSEEVLNKFRKILSNK